MTTKYKERPIRGYNPWLIKPMANRRQVVRGIMVHSTRGGSSDPNYDDAIGTEGWAQSPSNGSAQQGWGSSWELIIARTDGERIVTNDWDNSYASWCAGYGDAGTWAAGIYYLQWEFAQSRIDQPFTDVQIDSAAEAAAKASIKYDFPLVRIPYLAQVGEPPKGICTHEDSANGRKLHKSDPGPLFPWGEFISRAEDYRADMLGGRNDALSAEHIAKIDDLEKRLEQLMLVVGGHGYPVGEERLKEWDAIEYMRKQGFSLALQLHNLNVGVLSLDTARADDISRLNRAVIERDDARRMEISLLAERIDAIDPISGRPELAAVLEQLADATRNVAAALREG